MSRTKKARRRPPRVLKPIRQQVAGVDLGSTLHWVCGPVDEAGEREVRAFSGTTPGLLEMAAWLKSLGVESVAMESTHVYWVPVYELLEELGFEAVLVHARALKNAPGRKTDVHDCEWLQFLHSCGLFRGSFRPTEQICRLRALQRHRANLVEERSRAVQWMQKSLDQMNVRVHRAVSDITGVTGMKIIRAIVDGERDPKVLAQFRDSRCKKSVDEIADNLTGNWRSEHLFNLRSALKSYDYNQAEIAEYDDEIARVLRELTPTERQEEPAPEHPNHTKLKSMRRRGELELRDDLFRFAGQDLTMIDGISTETARILLTEVGPDVSAFESEKHFVSWLNLCPMTPISGGRPIGRKKSHAASRVGAALRMAAVTLQRTKTALGAIYRRLAAKKSAPVAVVAVARRLAIYVYRMLRYGTPYQDIGAEEHEKRFKERTIAAMEQTAKRFGLALVPAELAPN